MFEIYRSITHKKLFFIFTMTIKTNLKLPRIVVERMLNPIVIINQNKVLNIDVNGLLQF